MELERSATDAECEGSSPSWGTKGIVAQSVEQGPEKPCVIGSIPVDPTILERISYDSFYFRYDNWRFCCYSWNICTYCIKTI